jgi:hypothetical protein
MVAIVQSNPYLVLSRKIGYSVGLESLIRNVKALVRKYASDGRISLADWRGIVENDFGRGGLAYQHIADFLSALNLIKIIGNELYPLYGLDVLSILRRYLETDEAFDRALKVVVTQFLIEADGDIFLNVLDASFDREKARSNIVLSIDTKWTALRGTFVNPAIQDRVWDIVSIRSQTIGQMGSDETSASGSPFAKRTKPLSSLTRKVEVREEKYVVEVPDSYLKKILQTRKGWAEDLEYFSEKEITDRGRVLLNRLSDIGLRNQNGAIVFWPYASELAPLRLDYHSLNSIPVDNWAVACGIAIANGASVSDDSISDTDLIEVMRKVFQLYRSGNAARGSIRHQVPIYVMKPSIVGIFTGENQPIPPLPKFIETEIRGSLRRFDFTNVRGTEGALVFREKVN